MQNEKPGKKCKMPFSFGWSLNSENSLPLSKDHSIRIIWLNGKHPMSSPGPAAILKAEKTLGTRLRACTLDRF